MILGLIIHRRYQEPHNVSLRKFASQLLRLVVAGDVDHFLIVQLYRPIEAVGHCLQLSLRSSDIVHNHHLAMEFKVIFSIV
jgi:hypothetical protein